MTNHKTASLQMLTQILNVTTVCCSVGWQNFHPDSVCSVSYTEGKLQMEFQYAALYVR
jgi:hypothetical protein